MAMALAMALALALAMPLAKQTIAPGGGAQSGAAW
jgi:hypothetical protein